MQNLVIYIKKQWIRLLTACLFGIGMLLVLYFHLSLFSESALAGINVVETKEWYMIAKEDKIEQSFMPDYNQLDRACLQFVLDNECKQATVEIQLTQNDIVLYNAVHEIIGSNNENVELWINTGLLLENRDECVLTIKRIDDSVGGLYIRSKNSADVPFYINGTEAEDGALVAFEYHYINKINFFLCVFLVGLICIAIAVYIPVSERFLRVKEILYLVLMPLIMFLLFEWMVNGSIPAFKWSVFNYIWIFICYSVFCIVFRKINLVVSVISGFVYILACINYFVIMYRGRPLLPWDVKAFSTALSIADDFEYTFTVRMLIGLLITIFLIVLNSGYKRKEKYKAKVQLAVATTGIVVFALWGIIFYKTDLNVHMNFWTNMWDLQGTYSERGFALSTFNNLRYYRAEKPDNYNEEQVENYLIDATEDSDTNQGITPQNIIVIQSESFTDFSTLGNFVTDNDYLEYFHSVQDETSNGTLVVSAYGGGTCDTEWEVLTGNTLIFLTPSIVPYQTYVNDETVSLAKILKERGYRAIAMHPNVKENWNREQVFQDMGFDEFIDQSGYAGMSLVRDFYSDMANTEKIIETYENNQDKPLFIFNISMQNHGGYNYNEFESTVHLMGHEGDMSEVNQFLSLTKLTDDSIKTLFEYFSDVEEPTMIVIYGDHQPGLNLAFQEHLYGKPVSELNNVEALNIYKTPIMIWTNYVREPKEIGEISANYLSAVIMKEANLEMTSYQQFALELKEAFPILTTRGCLDNNGDYVTRDDIITTDLGYQYQCIQYNNLFDLSDELKDYYQ